MLADSTLVCVSVNNSIEYKKNKFVQGILDDRQLVIIHNS